MSDYFDMNSIYPRPDDKIYVYPTSRPSGKQLLWAMRGNGKTNLYYQRFKNYYESTGTHAVDNNKKGGN